MKSRSLLKRLGCGALAALTTFAGVGGVAAQGVIVTGAWTRPSAAGINGVGYLTIANHGRSADRLLGAASAAATKVSIHDSREIGGVATMRSIDALALRPGATVTFAPGGYHLMLEGLRRPTKLGERVPLTLQFFKAGALRVWLRVQAGPPEPGIANMKM